MPNFFLWQNQIQASRTNSSVNGCDVDVSSWAEYQRRGSPKPQACRAAHINSFERCISVQAKEPCRLTICILFVSQRLIIFRFLNLCQPSCSYKCESINHENRKKNDCGQGEFSVCLFYIVNNVVKYRLSTRCWGLIAGLQTWPAASSVISRLTPSTSSINIILITQWTQPMEI